jgi:hypothetical protein
LIVLTYDFENVGRRVFVYADWGDFDESMAKVSRPDLVLALSSRAAYAPLDECPNPCVGSVNWSQRALDIRASKGFVRRVIDGVKQVF